MKTEDVNTNLLIALKDKFPQKDVLVKVLMDTLPLGKEAIYRRLRGDVPFTLVDATIILRKLSISLDSTLGCPSSRSYPFQLKLIEFYQPLNVDIILAKDLIQYFSTMKGIPDTELGIATNILPLPLFSNFKLTSKFLLFKWVYQHGQKTSNIPYHEIMLSDEVRQIQKEFLRQTQNVERTYYVFDYMIFSALINDIKYFSEIGLVRDEDASNLKKELLDFIDFLEKLAIRGCHENGNKVQLYISNVNVESNYCYIQNPANTDVCLVQTFTLNPLISTDEKTFEAFKSRIQALKKSSILISESGESQRVSFFKRQQDYINSL